MARSSESHQDGIDDDEGQEQGEEEELDDDPIEDSDDDTNRPSSSQASVSTLLTSALPAHSPSSHASLEKKLEGSLTPQAGQAPVEGSSQAADLQPEPPALSKAGQGREVEGACLSLSFLPN